jgi:4-carboxymuconolactone decarboxylase
MSENQLGDDNGSTERWKKGAHWFDAVYGEGKAEGLIAMQTGLAQDLARYGVEFNFGDIYSRPGLTLAQRELLSLASLVTIGGVDAQLRGHTRGALNVGCTPTEILETVIHVVQYAGFPRALNAIRVVTDQLIESGVELPEPLS